MTRNFRDEWEATSPGDEPSEAPQHVQDQVSALLRRSAEEPSPAMPSHVEARLRAALSAEFGGGFDSAARLGATSRDAGTHAPHEASRESSTPRVVALPMRPAVAKAPADDDLTQDASSGSADRGAMTKTPTPASTPRSASASPGGPSQNGASVVSLDERRARKGRAGKIALALGAAAAVAIGAVTLTQTKKDDAPTAAAPSASTGVSEDYASRVRVTQTKTHYTAAALVKQASALPASKATPIEPAQANAQSIGDLGTGTGVQGCLDAVAPTEKAAPDHVYADMGTYDGQPAVIIVAEKAGKSTVWVVSKTCHVKSDLIAGPKALTT